MKLGLDAGRQKIGVFYLETINLCYNKNNIYWGMAENSGIRSGFLTKNLQQHGYAALILYFISGLILESIF